MIIKEEVEFLGNVLDRTYSDEDFMIYNIEEPEILYEEAVDPKGIDRRYAESEKKIGWEEELFEDESSASEPNYWQEWE